jgi:hypothetical protein
MTYIIRAAAYCTIAETVLYSFVCCFVWVQRLVRVFCGLLRKIFVPKREEVTGGRRRLHNEALYDLF